MRLPHVLSHPYAVLAAALAVCGAVPSPEAHFGHKIGADRTVLDWDRVVSYFRALERDSDRIQVQEYGKSTEGRPFVAAFIAARGTLRDLERYRQIQKRLADPARDAGSRSGTACGNRQGGRDDHLLDACHGDRLDARGRGIRLPARDGD